MKGYFIVDRDNAHTKFLKSKLVYSKELLDFMNIEYNFVTEMCEIVNDGKNINSLGTRNNYLFLKELRAN